MSPQIRRRLALVATMALLLNLFACFACWVIAIWSPWGHASDWGSTGAAGLFPAIALGFAAGILWTGGEAE